MATATLERTTEVVVVRPEGVPDAVTESYIRIQRGTSKAKRVVKKKSKKSWRGIRKAMHWTKTKSKKSAKAVKNKSKKVATVVKTKTVVASRWVATKAKAGGAAVSRQAHRFAAWARPIASSAWDTTARALAWVYTPIRLFLSTTAGLVSMVIFGGSAALMLTILWFGGVLTATRKKARRKTRTVVVERTPESAEVASQGQEEITFVPMPESSLTTDQQKALLDRKEQLETEGGKVIGNKARMSNIEGRLHLVNQRLAGVATTASVMYKDFRRNYEAVMNANQGLKDIDWNQFNVGMRAEDRLVRRMLAAKSDSSGKLTLNGGHPVAQPHGA